LSFYPDRNALPVIAVIGAVVVPNARISDRLSAAVAASMDAAINRILEECTS